MADDNENDAEADAGEEDDGTSFQDRVEEIRERREEVGEGDERGRGMADMMGGGPGGMGGGNPFAQMMGGMMGGGGPGGMMGGGGPGGPQAESGDEIRVDIGSLTSGLDGVQSAIEDATAELSRIADTLEEIEDELD